MLRVWINWRLTVTNRVQTNSTPSVLCTLHAHTIAAENIHAHSFRVPLRCRLLVGNDFIFANVDCLHAVWALWPCVQIFTTFHFVTVGRPTNVYRLYCGGRFLFCAEGILLVALSLAIHAVAVKWAIVWPGVRVPLTYYFLVFDLHCSLHHTVFVPLMYMIYQVAVFG